VALAAPQLAVCALVLADELTVDGRWFVDGWYWIAGYGVVAAFVIAVNATRTLTLTPAGARLGAPFPRRFGWDEVAAVAPRSNLGGSYVRLVMASGRTRRLGIPQSVFGLGRRRFERDVALIERRWLAHAG
jgi:hypothetical protein